jgi:HSP20 family protein
MDVPRPLKGDVLMMTTLARHERPRLTDMFRWLDNDFPTIAFTRPVTGEPMLRMEDYVEDSHYVLRAELPGIDPDRDVEITVEAGVLTVRAERRDEKRDSQRSEFHYGLFARSMSLPTGADENDVVATYKDGILEVRVAMMAEEAQEPKRISVAKG